MTFRATRPPAAAASAGPEAVHEVALRMLSRRALSAAEVRERLLRKGFAREVVAAELTRLRRLGMVDDQAVAGAVARESLRTCN